MMCRIVTSLQLVYFVFSQGLFGLGGAELAVIIVVIGLVLGPDKLASIAKDAGRMAGELKEVPKVRYLKLCRC